MGALVYPRAISSKRTWRIVSDDDDYINVNGSEDARQI